MEKLAPPLVILSILLTASILVLRHYWIGFNYLGISLTCVGLVVVVAVWAYRKAKRYFESEAEALVRLESEMNLYSSLTAAAAGKTSWPEFPDEQKTGVSWNYSRLLLPSVGALCLLLAAFTIPVQAVVHRLPTTAPRSWENLTADLQELKDQIQEDYIKEMEQRLGELKEQPEKDWYSHPSLEATENLQQLHKRELEQLSENLDKAEKSLSMLKQHSQEMTEAQRSRLMEQLKGAMEMMEKGQMKPNKELLEKLKDVDPNMLKSLTPEQLQQLRDKMRNMSDALKQQLREGLAPGEQLSDDNENLGQDGDGESTEGEGQGGLGNGDIQRGPGHAPRVLGREADELDKGDIEKLDLNNLENADPGDLLETTDGGEHDVDTSKTSQQQGEETENKGAGGEAVWKGNYLPDEKRALGKFFE